MFNGFSLAWYSTLTEQKVHFCQKYDSTYIRVLIHKIGWKHTQSVSTTWRTLFIFFVKMLFLICKLLIKISRIFWQNEIISISTYPNPFGEEVTGNMRCFFLCLLSSIIPFIIKIYLLFYTFWSTFCSFSNPCLSKTNISTSGYFSQVFHIQTKM